MSEIGITQRLDNALNKLARAKHPSVEKILRSHGYDYEADLICKILRAYDEEVGWTKAAKLFGVDVKSLRERNRMSRKKKSSKT